jgi:hypothetical protein
LTGEAGNASRRKVIVEATARSLEWASAWRTQDESGPTFSRVIRTNFGDRMAKIFRENSDSLVDTCWDTLSLGSLSYNLAYSIFGGTAPLLAIYLITKTANVAIPGLYLALSAIVAVVILLGIKKQLFKLI